MSTIEFLRSTYDEDEQFQSYGEAHAIYKSLLEQDPDSTEIEQGATYLREQLDKTEQLECDLPVAMEDLPDWIDQQVGKVAMSYAEYLKEREAGAPRRYFRCRSQALWYLQAIAPTKLVDGAWLYGLTRHWRDQRFLPLIKTYLEELGEGAAAKNHVLLFRKLLDQNGCETDQIEDDSIYTQGAIQLALGHNSDDFLPEVIGYNLGYEQPPLHMLITAYELKELDINPYYFTLHITTDNASSGHAREASKAVFRTAPTVGDATAFYERVRNGYLLNRLGPDTSELRHSYNTRRQTIDMLEKKRVYGCNMHSDHCRIEGKTVNQWLQTPGQIAAFLEALGEKGWVKHNDDPVHSRFWQLISGPEAVMAGVFTPYEEQLIYDWIAGDWLDDGTKLRGRVNTHNLSQRKVFRSHNRVHGERPEPDPISPGRNEGDLDYDVRLLNRELKGLPLNDKMARLIELMSPSMHASAAGLLATRMFSEIYRS